MVLYFYINNQKFDEFIFAKIITKKWFNFSSVIFRHTKSGLIFDTLFENFESPSIETTKSLAGNQGQRPLKSQIMESPLV